MCLAGDGQEHSLKPVWGAREGGGGDRRPESTQEVEALDAMCLAGDGHEHSLKE